MFWGANNRHVQIQFVDGHAPGRFFGWKLTEIVSSSVWFSLPLGDEGWGRRRRGRGDDLEVVVKGLPPQTDEQAIREFFAGCGETQQDHCIMRVQGETQ